MLAPSPYFAEVAPVVASSSAYAALIKSHNPLAYWRLGEVSGTSAKDEIGARNGAYTPSSNGVWTGGALGQAGTIAGDTDKAASFASNGSVIFPTVNFSSNAFTAEILIKVPFSGTKAIWSSADGSGVYISSSGRVNIRASGVAAATTSVSIPENAWAHLAVTRSTGNQVSYYINGTLNRTVGRTGVFTLDTLALGCESLMDEAAIYDYELSASLVAAHSNAAFGT